MMNSKEIQEIIIALIQNQSFRIGSSNEECAAEIAKFEKAYFDEISKNNQPIEPIINPYNNDDDLF